MRSLPAPALVARVGLFGQSPRTIRGSSFASRDHVYELWQSIELL